MFFSRMQRGPASAVPWNRERLRRDAAGQQRFIEVAGRRLCYWESGQGRPLVLLHGLGGSAFDWRHQIDPLAAAGYRVLAFDLLGAGLSDKPANADYSLRAQADLVKGALDRLGIPLAVFGGNSFGGGVSLIFAQLFPECVDGLILIDSVCYRQHLPEFVHLFRVPVLPRVLAGTIPTRPITQMVLWTAFGNAHGVPEDLINDYVLEVSIPDRKLGLVWTARDLIPRDAHHFEAGIRKIRTPALILWGEMDSIIPSRLALRLQKDLVGSELTVYERLGHIPHQEAPAVVNRRILGFLAGRYARGGARVRRAAMRPKP